MKITMMNNKISIEEIGSDYAAYRIPGLVLTNRNTLIAYYECRGASASDWADIDLKVIRSCDGGASWETAVLIPGKGSTLNNPVMIAEGERIHFLFCQDYQRLYYCFSDDEGEHFSAPVEISSTLSQADFFYNAVAIGPGHGIVHGGRLIIPMWFACNPTKPKSHHPSVVGTLYSEDHGKSWRLGELLPMGELKDPNESAMASLPDGRVLLSVRNESPERMRAMAYSPTGIGDWSLPVLQPTLRDPVCQGSLFSQGGLLYHVNCDSNSTRENLVLKISDDCFKTYRSILIDEIGGYADLAVKDREVYVLYERGALHGRGGLCFQRLTVEPFHL